MSVRSEIIDGMAEILWGSAWADHADEHDCTNISGMEITNVMPSIPKEAEQMAQDLAKKYESLNHMSLDKLYAVALEADEKGTRRRGEESPDRFGSDLAFMAMGAGVSWFDDHEKFPLKKPSYFENYELRILADDQCKDEGNPACPECGAYNPENKLKCANCGKELPTEEED